MIHCPQCGKPNGDAFRYCLGCGADLASAKAQFDALSVGGPVDASAGGSGDEAAALPRVPSPPRTPSPRAKGLVYAYTGRQSAFLILGVVFTLVGTVIFAVIGHDLVKDAAVVAAGRTVKGTVVDVTTSYHVRINGRHPLAIRYTFPAGKATARGSSSTLDVGFAMSLQKGMPIDVEAVPGFPLASRVKGTMSSVIGWFALFPLVFAAVGAPMWLAAVRSNRREIRAFRFGKAGVGRVTGFGPDRRVKVNGRHPTVLAFAIDVDGKEYTGALTHMEAAVLRPLIVGGQVPVVYDEKDPSANTVYVP